MEFAGVLRAGVAERLYNTFDDELVERQKVRTSIYNGPPL
jgi:hypothetical protein